MIQYGYVNVVYYLTNMINASYDDKGGVKK